MKHEIERFGSVSCKHRDLPKHNNWPFISDDRKKREKFWLAVSIGLRPGLAAYENHFSLFFFFPVPSYVGYVPASDDLGICCFVWRYEFLTKFLFVTEEKSTFRREAPDLSKHIMFWEIP